MILNNSSNFIVDLTPSICSKNPFAFNENDKCFELFLWYDAFIKPNDFKNIKLYCNNVIEYFQNQKEYFANIDKYFSDNNIYFKEPFHIIRDFDEIRVILYNKNDFSIHIKNGSKLAYSFKIKK